MGPEEWLVVAGYTLGDVHIGHSSFEATAEVRELGLLWQLRTGVGGNIYSDSGSRSLRLTLAQQEALYDLVVQLDKVLPGDDITDGTKRASLAELAKRVGWRLGPPPDYARGGPENRFLLQGLAAAECSTRLRLEKGRKPRPEFKVTNRDRKLLDHFEAMVQVGSVQPLDPNSPTGPRWVVSGWDQVAQAFDYLGCPLDRADAPLLSPLKESRRLLLVRAKELVDLGAWKVGHPQYGQWCQEVLLPLEQTAPLARLQPGLQARYDDRAAAAAAAGHPLDPQQRRFFGVPDHQGQLYGSWSAAAIAANSAAAVGPQKPFSLPKAGSVDPAPSGTPNPEAAERATAPKPAASGEAPGGAPKGSGNSGVLLRRASTNPFRPPPPLPAKLASG